MVGLVLAGLFACFIGAVWFGQGIGVIHGSGMTGHAVWAVLGTLLFIAGIGMFVSAGRVRKVQKAKD